jgi:hypothetical protein
MFRGRHGHGRHHHHQHGHQHGHAPHFGSRFHDVRQVNPIFQIIKSMGLFSQKHGLSKKCRRFESDKECSRKDKEYSRKGKECSRKSKCLRRRDQAEEKEKKLSSQFVQDVDYPDGTIVTPGSLVKHWLIKNAGSVQWPEGSKMIFVRGNRELLGETEEFFIPLAQAGESVEVSCPILVPRKSGRYSAYFQLADKDRTLFGHRFWIEIVVKAEEKQPSPSEKQEKADVKQDKADVQQEKADVKQEKADVKQEKADVKQEKADVKQEKADVKQEKADEGKSKVVLGLSSSIPAEPKYDSALTVLDKMGFVNEKLNLNLLERSQGNIEQVVSWLLGMENSMSQ